MLLVVVVLLSALAVPVFGGRLAALADVRARFAWVLLLGLGLQVVSLNVPGVPEGLRPVLQVVSYPVAGIFVVANRHLPGMLLIGLGALLNLTAIVVNGGVMPASAAALTTAGLPLDGEGYANSALVDDPLLPFLGDVFAIPDPLPLHNVFSIGDVCIASGAAFAIQRLCGSHLPTSRRPRGRHERRRGGRHERRRGGPHSRQRYYRALAS